MAVDAPDTAAEVIGGVLARAHVEADRLDDARHQLDEFATADFDLHMDSMWFAVMVDYAEAAIECADPRYAEPIFDRLAPWADQLATGNGVTADCPVTHFLGGLATVLGRYEEADTYFDHAATFSQRVGATFFAARTDLLWGRMLVQRGGPGDGERARDLFTKAHTTAAVHGYGNVERRAAAALQPMGP